MSGAAEGEEVTAGWLTGHLCLSCSLVRGSSETVDHASEIQEEESETTSIEYEFAAPRNAY